MTRILLFGTSGQVGRHLQSLLTGDFELRSLNRVEADLTDTGKISDEIKTFSPQFVINAAAYTAVDKAESEPELAYAVNASAPQAMAQAVHAANAVFIHYSTDYVFNGQAKTPYREDDTTDPQSVYGASKKQGELAIENSCAAHYILRTSWVYDSHGHNFLRTMLRLGKEREELKVVDDQTGSPTYAGDLAEATVKLVNRLKVGTTSSPGIYHATSQGQTTWRKFAQKIFELAGNTDVRVRPILTEDYPTPAKRPAYSVLDNSKLKQQFEINLPNWEDALGRCMARVD